MKSDQRNKMETLPNFVKNRTVYRIKIKKDGLRLSSLIIFSLSMAFPIEGYSGADSKPILAKEGTIALPLLKNVISSKMTGLQFESEEIRQSTKDLAKKLTFYFKDQLSVKVEAEWIEKCKTLSEDVDGFCSFLKGKEKIPVVSEPESILSKESVKDPEELEEQLLPPSSINAVIDHLKKGEIEALISATSSQLYSGLKRMKDPSDLSLIFQKALDKKESFHCKNPIIATALAQKCESFFPNPEMKEKMFSLFSKVRTCKGGGLTNSNVSPAQLSQLEAVDRAKFRYSVHKISDSKCGEAIPLLDELYATGNLEFNARVLFWKAHCAEKAGDKLKFTTLKQKLLKEAPLSYHSILLNGSDMAKISQVLSNDELTAYFRSDESYSKESKKINAKLRVVEGLLEVGSTDYARKVFLKSSALFLKAEPEVKLYMSVLAERMNDPITQFRFVGVAFREKSELINQNTLKLFYPLKNFDSIQNNASKLDPFFVAALIRQESGFNPNARSRVGAMGLMQLMPATARRLERVSRSMLWDPKVNVRLGSKYIGRLVQYYDMDAEMALAAYNAGENVVNLWRDRYVGYDRMAFLDLIPYKETRDYIALISRNFFWYHKLYGNTYKSPIEKRGVMSVLKSPLKGEIRADQTNRNKSTPSSDIFDQVILKQSSGIRNSSRQKKQDEVLKSDEEELVSLLNSPESFKSISE